MALEKSSGGLRPQVALLAFASLCLPLSFLVDTSLAQNVLIPSSQNGSDAGTDRISSVDETEEIDFGQIIRDVVAAGLSKVPRSLVRKLLSADVRFECSTSFLRTMRAFQNLEPWALRLLDATGKYPTGMMDVSRVDMGAFDECLATAVRDSNGNVLSRGLYCNLLVYVDNATALQVILNSSSEVMHPTLLSFSKHGFPPHDPLARLAICYIDDCNQHDLQAMVNAGLLFQVAAAFSVISNTRFLLRVAGKDEVHQQSLQFSHGLRFLAIMHIVLGHINVVVTDSYTGVLNLLNAMREWENMLIPAAFNSVDTFFFLRMCIPLFFIIMWFYLLPRIVDGPDTETFFQRFYADMSEHWWHLLVQIRNFFELKRTVPATEINMEVKADDVFKRPVNKFLSWNAFVPLSKLSYGVYLIHLPLFELMMHSSRERVYFSAFNQGTLYFGVIVWCFVFSYMVFVACEAPTAALDKLIFSRLTKSGSVQIQERPEKQLEDGDFSTLSDGGGEVNKTSPR
ncbi:hypothetical protein MTO96_019737 [Rhipicephalus appendiculatus]